MKRPLLRNIFVSLLAVTLFFGGAELFQRIKYALSMKDESYLFYGATDFELGLAKYFNRLKPHKPEEEYPDIVILGGSTVQCVGLPRELAWPERLERLFRRDGFKKVIVKNMGEGGSNSTKDVDRIRAVLRRYTPSVVVLSTGVNDSASMLVAKMGRSYVLPQEIRANFPIRLNAFLMKRSLFYTTLREKIAKIFMRDINRAYGAWKLDPEDKKKLLTIDGLGTRRLRDNILRVIDITGKLGIRLVLASPPVDYSPDDNYRISHDRLRDEMGKISKEYGIPYVDVARRFYDLDDRSSFFLPGDRVHVNKKGAQEEARIVYEFLRSIEPRLLTGEG